MKYKVLCLIAVLCALVACTKTGDPGKSKGNSVVVNLLENGIISKKKGSLDDYVGNGKYSLLFFWASWCFHCEQAAPNVEAAYEKYRDKGLEVVGISEDSDTEAAVKAIQDLELHFPQILDPSRELGKKYDILGYPQILLIAPDGSIVQNNIGSTNLDSTLQNVL